jgi:hypothetical protein
LPTAPPPIADVKNPPNLNQERNRKKPAADDMEKTRTRHEMAMKGSREDKKVGIPGTPLLFSFLTMFDTQPFEFSCSRPSLALKSETEGFLYYIFTYYHIRTLPPSLAQNARRRGVPSSTSSPHDTLTSPTNPTYPPNT